jgi:large subunit ribosomal protein L10
VALNLEQKQAIVSEVAEVAAKAHSAIAAEYMGLTSAKMTTLRAKAREQGVYMRVVKNTLARRAVEGTEFACLQDGLTGPLLLAFSLDDPGAAARVIKDFVKENEKMVVKLVAVGGKLFAANELDRLASLPTKEQAIAMLMGHAKLVRTFAAVRDQKQAA